MHDVPHFNPDCPIVDKDAAEEIRHMLDRFVRLLGFQRVEDTRFVSDSPLAANRSNSQAPGNHSILRISYVIRGMRLFGQEQDAEAFFKAVHDSAFKTHCLSKKTLRYWRLA